MDINIENTKQLLKISRDSVKCNFAYDMELVKKIKWKTVSFTIPEEPEPSHRPRLCGYRVYVPGAARHQAFFNKNVLPKLNGLYITTPCKINVDIYCKTPKSYTKTQQLLAESKIIRPWTNIGDIDNFLKTTLDAIQPNEKRGHVGIMENDCLIISTNANKYYSITPRSEVTISYMTNIPDDLKKVFKIINQ